MHETKTTSPPGKSPPAFKQKAIAFVDILGFSQKVEKATDADLPELLEMMALLGKPLDAAGFAHGPTTCPDAEYIDKRLDFCVTQVSDCVVVSAELSPAGVINLIQYCYGIAVRVLTRGYQCRGSIVIGPIHHVGVSIVGEGYQRAANGEKAVTAFSAPTLAETAGGPFIEIGPDVLDYIASQPDKCVKDMFRRMTHSDGTVTAIYPFYAVAESHMTVVDKSFDPLKWLKSVNSWRNRWVEMRSELEAQAKASPSKVAAKYRHSITGVNHIIQRADDRIASLHHIIRTGRLPREGSTWGTL